MAEEFIADIIGQTESEIKTESQMVEEIQKPAEEVPAKPTEDDADKGSEATPDLQKPEESEVTDESDDVKELAAQLGWREDHTGDDAVDAKTYILKSKDIQKSMSQHNKDLKDQLKGLGNSVDALKQHNEQVYKSELKKLTSEIAELKKERNAAIELADVDAVHALDEKIDDIQKDIDAPKAEKENASDNPAYDSWVKDNQWYLEDTEMATFADAVAEQFVGAPLERVYKIVRDRVKEVFPEKFESVKASEAKEEVKVKPAPVGPKSPVESSSAKGQEAAFTKADLTMDQQQIMRQFVNSGIMTEEQYVNDIAKMQG